MVTAPVPVTESQFRHQTSTLSSTLTLMFAPLVLFTAASALPMGVCVLTPVVAGYTRPGFAVSSAISLPIWQDWPDGIGREIMLIARNQVDRVLVRAAMGLPFFPS